MSETPKWTNRIVGHDEVAPDQLLANPLNFRIHPSAQQSALSGSLDSLGWIQEVLVNKNTGHVIDGHLRIQLALRNDEKTIPVTYLDLTEDEERLALLSLDPIAAMAATDKEQLETLLSQVNSDDQRVQEFLSNLAKESGLTYGVQEQSDAEPQIDKAEELQKIWGVCMGDLYAIGSHKLLCGDSTKREDVEMVMGGEMADLIWTDPPYGINYKGGAKEREEIDNDDDILIAQTGIKLSSDFIKMGGVIYLAAPPARLFEFWELFIDAGFHYSTLLVWVKNNMAGGWGDYRGAYENIFYGWKEGATHYWCGARDKQTVFKFDKPAKSDEHPTMKPIELIQEHIGNSTQVNEMVYDPFVGSGTTMVACQNLSRKCRAIEISPKYCAVILQRMTDAFQGIIIEKIDSV
jgi:DNA modification methylase